MPGGRLEKKEELQEKVKNKIGEKTGLEIDVHQLIDVYYDEIGDILRIVYHCESDGRETEAADNLEEIEWTEPERIGKELGELENDVLLERDAILKFLEKLEKMPAF